MAGYDDFSEPVQPAAAPAADPYASFSEVVTNPAVTPGDEGMRRVQVESKDSNFAAPTRSTDMNPLTAIPREAAAGAKEIGKSFSSLGKPSESLLETPAAQLGLGVARTGGSIFAPIDAAASTVGSKVQDKLMGAGLGPTASAIPATLADMLVNFGSLEIPNLLRAGATRLAPEAVKSMDATVSNFLKSKRMRANEATATAAKDTAAIDAAQQQDLANIGARNESFQSFADAASQGLPDRSNVKALSGDKLAQDTGKAFKEHFEDVRAARKAEAEKRYEYAIGKSDQSVVDALDREDELRNAYLNAGSPADREAALKELNGIANTRVSGENLQQLHEQLKEVRSAHYRATNIQNDRLARQLGSKESEILTEMDKMRPGTAARLADADRYYSQQFAPYFGSKAIPRAIANRDAATIARTAILPTDKTGKAAQTIDRVSELLAGNESLRSDVAHAHLNGLIDEASKSGDFRSAFVKAWDRYTNPSGNNNYVLRKAYGKEYDDVSSLVNQFRNAKSRDLSQVAAEVVKQGEKEGKQIGALAADKKQFIEKKLKEDVERLTGKPYSSSSTSMFGPLLITEGLGHMAMGSPIGVKMIGAGTAVMLTRPALTKLLNAQRGRSSIKALLRSLPGSTQVAANARRIQNILEQLPSEDDNGQ